MKPKKISLIEAMERRWSVEKMMTGWETLDTLSKAIEKLEEGCEVEWTTRQYTDEYWMNLICESEIININIEDYLNSNNLRFRYKPKEVKTLTLKEITDRWWRCIPEGWEDWHRVWDISKSLKMIRIFNSWWDIKDLSDPTKWEGKTIQELEDERNDS